MKICSYCDAQNEDMAIVCRKCGRMLETKPWKFFFMLFILVTFAWAECFFDIKVNRSNSFYNDTKESGNQGKINKKLNRL